MTQDMVEALRAADTQVSNNQVQYVLSKIKESDNDLSIINDPYSISVIVKLYQRFINEGDMRGVPGFLLEVDRMLVNYGGKPKANDQPE